MFASIFRNRQFWQASFSADGTSVRKIFLNEFELYELVVLTERIQYHTSPLGRIIYLNNICVVPLSHLFLMSPVHSTLASCSWEWPGVRYRIAQTYECYGDVMGQWLSVMAVIGSLVLSEVRQRHTSLPALLIDWFREMHGTWFFLLHCFTVHFHSPSLLVPTNALF
jgi:hypothetical protein